MQFVKFGMVKLTRREKTDITVNCMLYATARTLVCMRVCVRERESMWKEPCEPLEPA
jgi:hypothetical protein